MTACRARTQSQYFLHPRHHPAIDVHQQSAQDGTTPLHLRSRIFLSCLRILLCRSHETHVLGSMGYCSYVWPPMSASAPTIKIRDALFEEGTEHTHSTMKYSFWRQCWNVNLHRLWLVPCSTSALLANSCRFQSIEAKTLKMYRFFLLPWPKRTKPFCIPMFSCIGPEVIAVYSVLIPKRSLHNEKMDVSLQDRLEPLNSSNVRVPSGCPRLRKAVLLLCAHT